MKLLLSVPTGVLVDEDVTKVIAEADFGSFAVLPLHADTATLLVPGLLAFHRPAGQEVFVAVDHGLLVKTDRQLRVACQRAHVAGDLGTAEATVREHYRQRTESQKRARSAIIRLETEIVRRVMELGH